ncbi:hypothetical protein QR680_001273 [Steinernema hermaphroditum]|uniref:DNA helicase n=1 Tax=Steinernema hermaphroditum TaxID=289476 RepID=A0AA39GXL1_9BILA|nr:hypothetical protein QR680_001273 [Steinernema hermaphroditum]
MDGEDSFENDGDFMLTSNVADFPSLLTGNKLELVVTEFHKTKEDELFVIGQLCPNNETTVRVFLRGAWCDSPLQIGYRVKIFDPQGYKIKPSTSDTQEADADMEVHVDDKHGLVIIEPNVLISSTTISQSFYCQRKAVLLERFRGASASNSAMLIGNCVHMLFQSALIEKTVVIDDKWLLDKFYKSILPGVAIQMIGIKMTPESLENEIKPYFKIITEWINQYVRSGTGSDRQFHGTHVIDEVADIEENIWMPAIGVKGKIDASLKVRNVNSRKEFTSALELKTGNSKMNFDHNGQVLLYSMMLSLSKNFGSIEPGFLLYLKDGSFRPVVPKAMDLRGIIKCRNEIASFLAMIEINSLPPPLSSSRYCDKCPMSTACSIYQRMDRKIDHTSLEMQQFTTSLTTHLSSSHMEYFMRWTRWTMMEWSTADSQRMNAKSLWTVNAKTREKKGHCIASALLNRQESVEEYAHLVFSREDTLPRVFNKGDYAIISTDYQFALIMGSVLSVNGNVMTVRCDKPMPDVSVGKRFHIDKHESFTTYSMNLANIVSLMENSERSDRLRKLIIDKVSPEKRKVSKKDYEGVIPLIKHLNKQQSAAVLKALFIKDFLIVEGFPGSGKTSTICALVQCLEKLGKTILITAYTNSAVDNILRKLVKVLPSEKLLRLGSSNINSDVKSLTLDAKIGDDMSSTERYESMRSILANTPIVATTCLMASSHPLFSWRKFDMCVVDEASLVTENTLIASLLLCEAFVLVGDTNQLCPLVLNRNAREEGMNVSLLEGLAYNDGFMVSLNEQYRMNSVISNLCSTLFYAGRMTCGNDEVASRTVFIENKENIDPLQRDGFGLCLSTSLDDSVILIDTSRCSASKFAERVGGAQGDIFNQGEAVYIATLCTTFIEKLVSPCDIGVMVTYKYQAKVIKEMLEDSRIEVNTVDQYQGREKKVMIMSLVHTDFNRNCELLSDPRRINVAVSRAQAKLIIVGHSERCRHYFVMKELFQSIPKKFILSDM